MAATSVAAAVTFMVATPAVDAETAVPGIEYEGWFARSRPQDPQVDTCGPGGVLGTTTTQPCGPTSPADVPTAQSKGTGHYVVASSGGTTGDGPQNSGDTGWAAFRWDLLDQFGASANKFVVTLFQATPTQSGPDQQTRLDTYNGTGTPPPIQACNVLESWASEPGSNPWETRPKASVSCVAPTSVTGRGFTFDLTSFASTWLDGTGYGIVIRPGSPTTETVDRPFQLTFVGYYDQTPDAQKPIVTFEYTPAFEDDGGFTDGGFVDGGFEDFTTDGGSSFEAAPSLDIIPTDAGSDPLPEQVTPAPEATPTSPLVAAPPTRRISTDTPFPWIVLLLIPFILIAFWSTGTALGSLGDPVPARAGGVSRVLASRQAGGSPTDPNTRY